MYILYNEMTISHSSGPGVENIISVLSTIIIMFYFHCRKETQ